MAGRNTVSLTVILAKLKISMAALRAAVLAMFAVSVVVTAWSMLSVHSHLLHIAHVALISLTFLLIALYLYKSAVLASHAVYREMRLRLTVDSSAGFIEHVPSGSPVLNACVGALARNGIYVRSELSLKSLARLGIIAVAGNYESREGYIATAATLSDMGVELSADVDSCPIKLKLGQFSPEAVPDYDFVLTHDKIAYILAAVYISRVYVRFALYGRLLSICALAAAVALPVFGYITYAAAAIAFLSASRILLVRRIERRTARLTFVSVVKYKK